jgi:hypothetical protein
VSRRTSQLGLLDKSLFVLGHLGQRGVAIESESKIGFHNSVGFRLLAIIRQSLGAEPCHASFGLGLAHRTFVQIKGTKNFPNLQNIKLFSKKSTTPKPLLPQRARPVFWTGRVVFLLRNQHQILDGENVNSVVIGAWFS